MILVLHRAGDLLGFIPNGEIHDGHVWVGSFRVASGLNCELTHVPDQPISHLYKGDPPTLSGKLSDLRQFTAEQQAALVDRDTGRTIKQELHQFSGTEEELGIHRAQLVAALNTLGLPATPEFAKLNEIAVKEIEAARVKKEAI